MSTRPKPDRFYPVALFAADAREPWREVVTERRAITGTTFYEARARLCAAQPGTEPGDVRLDPPRRMGTSKPITSRTELGSDDAVAVAHVAIVPAKREQ